MGGRYGKYGEVKRMERLRQAGEPQDDASIERPDHSPVKERVDMKVSIRKARPKDAVTIGTLAETSFEAYGPYGSTIRDWLGFNGITTLVACQKREVAGFIMYAPIHSITTVLMEIMAVSVAPEAHRRGVGTRLLAAAEANALREGGVYMLLHTATTNLAAQSFFRGHGYKVVETKRRYYPKGQDALRMIKRLR